MKARQLSALLLAGLLALAWPAMAVEVNTASQAELEMLKGVGPQLSEAMLAARRERPFRDWADLRARLKGVGPARASKLSAAGLRVDGQAWPAVPAASNAASEAQAGKLRP